MMGTLTYYMDIYRKFNRYLQNHSAEKLQKCLNTVNLLCKLYRNPKNVIGYFRFFKESPTLKTSTNRFFLIFILVFLPLFFSKRITHAQPDVGQATQEVDRKIRREVQKELQPPPPEKPDIEEKEAEKVTKGPSFSVKKIILKGTKTFKPEQFSHLIEKYENREVNMGELNSLAKEVEREYLRKGVIAACYIPPQEVRDGVVTLQVVEARFGSLKIKEHKFFEEERLQYYWSTRPGEVLRYDKMARDLYEMNKNPDRVVKSTLYAGDKPGTTDVLLDAQTTFPVHPSFTYDREGVVSSGKDRLGWGLRHNNLLFVDDILITGYNFGEHFWGIYGYHSVPITPFGTSVMYGYSYSESSPKKDFAPLLLESRSSNSSFFVHQDLFTKGRYIGELYTGFEAKDKTSTIADGTLNRDRLRLLRFGGNFIIQRPGSVTYINPELTQGINGFGARGKTPFSSRDTSNTFFIAKGDLTHRVALDLGIQGVVRLSGQVAGEMLPPQEQYSLGGIDTIRGYPPGDYLADNAFRSNFELLLPGSFLPIHIKLPFSDKLLRDAVTGIVFFDYGYGEKRGDRTTEEKNMNLASIGTGMRINLYDKFTLRLEWGFVTGDKPMTEYAKSRFHISLDLRY
ncbi:MAG: hypothetical protein GF409_01715 [Candidatus Omnitrophica bacterium]|nr:hypothetical protein [Candidatus Omnitrophota bacterium]